MNTAHPLEPVLAFVEERDADRNQARKLLRDYIFKSALGRDPADHPATRMLISLLINGVKPLTKENRTRNRELDRLLRGLKSSRDEAALEGLMDGLRQVSAWLRDGDAPSAPTEEEEVELQDILEVAPVASTPDSGLPPALLKRLIQGILALGAEAPWIKTQGEVLLRQVESLDQKEPGAQDRFRKALAEFCDRVVGEGEKLIQLWRSEREALVSLVATVAGCLEEARSHTGGFDQTLGEAITRLRASDTLTDLNKLREALVREAEALKEQTRQAHQRLAHNQERLRETEQQLNEAMEELTQTRVESMTDPLTGVPNRRAFDKQIARETARAARHRLPMSVLMFDLDHFKRVNDTYGHPVGDKVLTAVAKRANSLLRQSDFMARVGGEEFTAVLPETELAAAVNVADKIRQELAKLRFKTKNHMIQITSSFGVCSVPGGGLGQPEDIAALARQVVDCADQALYRAKESGRNRVEAAAFPGADAAEQKPA